MSKLKLPNIKLKYSTRLLLSAALVFSVFLAVGLATLSDYGISWDSAIHFIRGQAYLYYFSTGKTDYRDLATDQNFRRSYYQTDAPSANFFLESDSGHPPLSDVLSSIFNSIFYQKLGILGDVEGYHLFIVFTSAVLVALVFYWAAREYGWFAGSLATLAMALYPIFFGESHFNIKDPAETAFFSLTLFSFYQGIKNDSRRWVLASAIFCGLALGTKFNILFLPLIIFPWLVIRLPKLSAKTILFLFLCPLIVLGIVFLGWPYLWRDPLVNFLNILNYYGKIGSTPLAGFNLYPIKTIFYTTPSITLFFFLIGVLSCLFLFRREKQKTSFLFLIWFLIPVLRVSLPGASIYGGTRQIMEFIPAMALLAGVGAEMTRKKLVKLAGGFWPQRKAFIHYSLFIVLLCGFIPIALKLKEIHPNENVYFNQLIGGLAGAKEKNYPYWGLSLGNPYKQGIDWLNRNAEKEARVALVIGTGANIYRPYLRSDIKYDNQFWSGYKREGEYLMEVVYQNWIRVYQFCGDYVDRLLTPVYEVKVEGIPILKIWRNDAAHTNPRFLKEETLVAGPKDFQLQGNTLTIGLEKETELLRVTIDYYQENNCLSLGSTSFYTSIDGKNWQMLKEPIKEYMVESGKLIYPMAAEKAKYIKIKADDKINCVMAVKKIVISRLTE